MVLGAGHLTQATWVQIPPRPDKETVAANVFVAGLCAWFMTERHD